MSRANSSPSSFPLAISMPKGETFPWKRGHKSILPIQKHGPCRVFDSNQHCGRRRVFTRIPSSDTISLARAPGGWPSLPVGFDLIPNQESGCPVLCEAKRGNHTAWDNGGSSRSGKPREQTGSFLRLSRRRKSQRGLGWAPDPVEIGSHPSVPLFRPSVPFSVPFIL